MSIRHWEMGVTGSCKYLHKCLCWSVHKNSSVPSSAPFSPRGSTSQMTEGRVPLMKRMVRL